jgi:ParB family chromosome partitioning protein
VFARRGWQVTTVPGFVREDVDPYAQAIENMQREDLLPLDLAAFVMERERHRFPAEITRRLGKPRP